MNFFIALLVAVSAWPADFSAELEKTIRAHQLAESYYDWESSANHPHKLFERLTLEIDSNEKAAMLCKSLQKISPIDMNIFLAELFNSPALLSYDCINSYAISGRSFIILSTHQLNVERFGPDYDFDTYSTPAPLGPTRNEVIDTNGGPIFNYGQKGRLGTKEISLTFDDGPHPTLTYDLLNILDQEDVKATFFVVGRNAERYPNIVKEIVARGHTLATHSYSHKNLPKLSSSRAEEEIENGFSATLSSIDFVAPFFRFPYGSKNKSLVDFVKLNDLASFFWDVDTLDWKLKDPNTLLDYALNQTESTGRGIVLFHDIQPQTIAMMPVFLRELESRSYSTVLYTPKEWLYLDENNSLDTGK